MLKATPDDHLGDAGGDHLRHGAERDAAECDRERAGHVRLHRRPLGTVLNAGASQTLSVTFTPTDAANYTTRDRRRSITVLKATPAITWATPADITYGTALERDAAERDGERAGHVRLHAGGRRRC